VKKKSGKPTSKEMLGEISSLRMSVYRLEHLYNSLLEFINDYMEMSKTAKKMNDFLDKKYRKEDDGKNKGKAI